MAEPIRYRIDLADRRHHLVRVRMTIPAELAAGARLVFPTWTPGSYVVRDYVHHLQQITARDPGGRRLVLEPEGVGAWRLPRSLDNPVTVDLELYANEPTVRTNHVDDRHALVVGPATFPYVAGAGQRRHVVELKAPDGERVFSLLPPGAGADTYAAADRDHLMDAAFEIGDHPAVEFDVAGVAHRFVWAGPGDGPDHRLIDDASAVCRAAVNLFDGQLPTANYTFLCVVLGGGWGGLEHRDGATLMAPATALHAPEQARRLQSLIAHEYLHLWNGKRLTPATLQELDYVDRAPSPSLWVVEGWTCYYDALLPLRAGVWPLEHFAGQLAARVQRVREAPATGLQSVREASRQAWVKHYVRDENTVNSSVDYYTHGAVLAWCLDLLIRRENPDADGLDTALRLLWGRFGTTGEGYTEPDVQAACEEAAGASLAGFFDDYVASPAQPPVAELVEVVGLRLVEDGSEGPTPWLGAHIEEDGDSVVLSAVLREGPAWRAGLTGGDELLAIDGLRVTPDNLDDLLAMHEPGGSLPVTVFRDSRLERAEVGLERRRPPQRLATVEQPTPAQQAAFHGWTSLRLDELDGTSPAAPRSR